MSSQSELAAPPASHQSGVAEWLLGAVGTHLPEELAWGTGRECLR